MGWAQASLANEARVRPPVLALFSCMLRLLCLVAIATFASASHFSYLDDSLVEKVASSLSVQDLARLRLAGYRGAERQWEAFRETRRTCPDRLYQDLLPHHEGVFPIEERIHLVGELACFQALQLYCNVRPEGSPLIPVAIMDATSLNLVPICMQVVEFGDEEEALTAEQVQMFLVFLRDSTVATSLRSISLNAHHLELEHAFAIVRALKGYTALESVTLSNWPGDEEEDASFAAILKVLLHQRNLTELAIYDTGIGVRSAATMAQLLGTSQSLEELSLVGCQSDEYPRIFSGLKHNGHLQLLSFRDADLGDEDVTELVSALKSNSVLSRLYLESNSIGEEGTKEIAALLSDPRHGITELNLGDNSIGPGGAFVIAKALVFNERLTMLNLERNHLGDHGARDLAFAIRDNRFLQELYLCGNFISGNGARGLAQSLITNQALNTLDLSDNPLHMDGVKAILQVLHMNTALKTLVLNRNQVGMDDEDVVATTLKSAFSLESLSMRGNFFGAAGVKHLERMASRHTSLRVWDFQK